MRIDYPTPALMAAQRGLWQQAFGDDDAFLDAFFGTGYAPRRCRCVTLDGKLAACVYWFDHTWKGQKIAYLYALATAHRYRGHGLAHRLLEDVEELLKAQNYAGALLVPGSPELFSFYGKMGYISMNCAEKITVSASSPIPVRKIDSAEYDKIRKALLGPNGLFLDSENLPFLSSCWTLYAGNRWVLAGFDKGAEFVGMELLGDINAAPGILAALGKNAGTFRIPGQDPFAMYKPLNDPEIPHYFGLDLA